MIGKLLPRALNKDTDARLLKSYEMTDAVNVQISTGKDGDKGVLKNIRSTASATNTDSYSIGDGVDTAVVVGSVEDHEKGFVYFFVWNEQATQHAIVKYDVSDNEYSIVVKGSLNFPKYGYVDATLLNDPVYGDNSFIFFTDNVNEPRKVNVNRLPTGYDGTQDITEYPEYIHACIKTPLTPASFDFITDLEFTKRNHFYRTAGVYFAYRFVLKDGFYSPISVYSKVAIPYNNVQQGDTGINYNSSNCCLVKIPSYASYDGEIDKIQFIKREGNAGNMYVIDEVSASSNVVRTVDNITRTIWDATSREFRFYNDGNYSVLPDQDILKIEEGVPQKASAVTLSGDRIMYGDYVEGYDNTDVSASKINVVYRPVDSDPVDISVSSSLVGGSSACTVDLSNLPTTIQEGSTLSFSIETQPADIYSYDSDGVALNAAGSLQVGDQDIFYGSDVTHPIRTQSYGLSFGLTVYIGGGNQSLSDIAQNITNHINGNAVDDWFDVVVSSLSSSEFTGGSIKRNGTNTQYNILSAKFTFLATESTSTSTSFSFKTKLQDVTDITFLQPAGGGSVPTVVDEGGFFDTPTGDVISVRYIATTESSVSFYDNNSYFSEYEGFQTFKSGCNHEFGIVYYDGRGRRSNVNYIGSAYVKEQGERDNKGRVQVDIDLSEVTPPSWATNYQAVYGGNSTIDEFIQFSVPDAYITSNNFESDSIGIDAPTSELIFVPTAFLQNSEVSYADVTGAVATDGSPVLYKHSEGDVLRIVKYYTDETTEVYPIRFEFEVIGVRTFTDDDNPLVADAQSSQTYTTGEFLVLRDNANCTDFTRNDVLNGTDKWRDRVFVEVYKPKKFAESDSIVFYETGFLGDINEQNNHFPALAPIRVGDCFFRRKYMNHNYQAEGSFFVPLDNTDDGWQLASNYANFYLEAVSFNDKYKTDTPNRGRAGFVVDTSKQIRRKSSITFSERHILANGRNYLTSFNKHQNNKYDLPPKYGAINRLVDQSEFITCLQERKVSRVPIDRSIISNATGDQQLILSTEPLGTASFYRGDYGSANDPSSVINVNGNVYFVDKRVGKVLKLSSEGLSVPSDLNMSSYFEGKLLPINDVAEYWLTAGYDPMNEEVLFTYSSSDGGTFTIAFSDSQSYWKSRYTFYPTKYAHMNGRLISARNTLFIGENLIHLHEEALTYGVFHDLAFEDSFLSMVMNYNPSLSKVMQAVSIEGTEKWSAEIYNYKNDGTLLTTGEFSDFVEKENTWWTGIPRSKSDNYKISIGEVASVIGVNVTFTTPVTNIAIPNGIVYIEGNSSPVNTIQSSNISIVDRFTLAINGASAVSEGDVLYVVPNSTQNGDPIRGQYCHVDLSYSENSDPIELYAVNIDFVSSRLDASLGTQAE